MRGTLPDSIANLTALTYGARDRWGLLWQCSLLANLCCRYMNLFGNEITGTIPSTIGTMISLRCVVRAVSCVSCDHGKHRVCMRGRISGALGSDSRYRSYCWILSCRDLTLDKNLLYGTIPSALGNLTTLQ
jgi:hypothetical protein